MGILGTIVAFVAPSAVFSLRVLSWVKNAFGFAARYPLQCALVASLAANAWLYHSRFECEADATAFKTQVISAQNQAQALAIAERAKIEAQYKEKADEADRKYQDAYRADDSRVSDYVSSHRMRAIRQSASVQSTTATQGADAQNPDRPGGTPDLVGVTPNDMRICTINTERLQAAHNWAVDQQ